uniref:ORM1-like protein n=3 Tax=Macrostomum lignano TaxID=282301 RepID=A0A1I8GRK8_9PLAT
MQVGTAHSDPNPNHVYFNSRGIWATYVIFIFITHFIVLSIPFISMALAWTLTCQIHNVITYFWLHWEKGAPFEPLDQGESRTLTHWEQLDDGVQFTANKKFLLVVPIVIFLLTTFYTRYDQIHFLVNALSLVLLAIVPKLPQLYRVRIFGINKW